MPTPAKVLIGIILAAGIFLAGYVANRRAVPVVSSDSTRQATSYTCPMHPQYRSDHPGDCPICGMRLEPVATGGALGKSEPAGVDAPGMVVVGAGMQQRIGIHTDAVRRDSTSHMLRVPGRITVDDQRLYRIIAAADGWIVELRENTVGRFVKKDQLLASYYTRELLGTERLFLLSVAASDPSQKGEAGTPSIRTGTSLIPQYPVDSLRGLGMSDLQIEEIQRTRIPMPSVNIYSPVSGFVLARNISPGQRFEKATEFFRIADISHLWVMTDIFEKDSQFLKPGAEATILYQGRQLKARMSDALPQFDAESRTLKTRFELDNPGNVLQPGMFVDVELNVEMPPAITVPADAVFDSGLRKTVFVDRGNGNFEARRVKTGWRLGDRIEIVSGLMEGERIVGAANFLLDSESRMKAASAGILNPETDPVCGMDVDHDRARSAGRTSTHKDVEYYFCSDDCKKKFDADPAKYLTSAHGTQPAAAPSAPAATKTAKSTMPQASQTSKAQAQATDPVCGMDVDEKEATAAGRRADYNGRTYYFCSDDCKTKFDKEPAKYANK